MKYGKLIVVCGTEGSGKTTAVKRLMQSDLASCFVNTREPGGSPNAEKVRGLVLSPEAANWSAEARFYMMWAGRMIHLQEKIIPALKAGKHVICDRFDCCTYAFQIFGETAAGLEGPFRVVRREMIEEFLPRFSLHYIQFDLPPEVGLARKAGIGEERNYFDDKKLDFHCRIRQGYRSFATTFLNRPEPMRVIDASQSPDLVWRDFRAEIDNIFQRK